MSTLKTYCSDEFIQLPYATSLRLAYRNRESGELTARILNGSRDNHYIAAFNGDNMDFDIIIDNAENRRILFDVEANEASCQFIAKENSISTFNFMEILEGHHPPQRNCGTNESSAADLTQLNFTICYSVIPTVNICVRSTGSSSSMNFVMRLDENIIKLKLLIYEQYRVSPHRQSVYRGDELLYNLGMIGQLFRDETNVVTVQFDAIPVFIEFVEFSRTRPYTARPSDTVRDLEYTIQWDHSMCLREFYLVYKGRVLAQDMILQDCEIDENAVIEMVRGEQTVSVKCFNEMGNLFNKFVIEVDPLNTTEHAFQLACRDKGAPANATFLHLSNLFGHSNQFNNEIVCGQNVICVVELLNKKRHESDSYPIFIDIRGKRVRINVGNNCTIADVRSMIERQMMDENDFQNYLLTLEQSTLKEEQSLVECGVKPGALLKMKPREEELSVKYPVLPNRIRHSQDDIEELQQSRGEYLPFLRNKSAIIEPFVIQLKHINDHDL